MRNGRRVNAEYLKVFYLVPLFIVLTLATMRCFVKSGIAERLGDENAKYLSIFVAMSITYAAALGYVRYRRR